MEKYIGCSGFYYADWSKKFYPEGLPKNKWLEYYAEHFNTVEINNTFYRMPTPKLVQGWKKRTPQDFKLTLKANRFFTHLKKLTIDDEFRQRLEEFDETAKQLSDKLACVLWQLPKSVHKDAEKLATWCKTIDPGMTHVIEFRHLSWFDQEISALLKKHHVSICFLSAPDQLPEDLPATSDTIYLRFHGKTAWYNYHYSEEELQKWADRIRQFGQVERLFAYFNNDYHAYAVDNAKSFNAML